MNFFVKDANSLIHVEIEGRDSATILLNKLIDDEKNNDIKCKIKSC